MKKLKRKSNITLLFLSTLCSFFIIQSSDSITDEPSAFDMSMVDAFGESCNNSRPTPVRMLDFPKLDTTITPLDANTQSAQQSLAQQRQTQNSTSSESSLSNDNKQSQGVGRLIKKDSINSLVKQEIRHQQDALAPAATPKHPLNQHVHHALNRLLKEDRTRISRDSLIDDIMFQAIMNEDLESETDSDSDILVINPLQNHRSTPLSEPRNLNCEPTQQHKETSAQQSWFKRLFSCCHEETTN